MPEADQYTVCSPIISCVSKDVVQHPCYLVEKVILTIYLHGVYRTSVSNSLQQPIPKNQFLPCTASF